MDKANTTSILASFATLKSLNDTKKYTNSYQILGEFIGYIISTEKLYTFTPIEMKNRLNSVFGFDIPEAVVKTASKGLPFLTRSAGAYSVDTCNFVQDTSFEDIKTSAESTNLSIIDSLSSYIKEKEPEKEIYLNVLTKDFIAFLVDDQQKCSGQYTNLISEFILKNENNIAMQDSLKAIKEGSILYLGLNHNINETGSLTKNLTLYLGTEVLFSLVGFNGEIYKQLALDLFSQIKNANANEQKIKLRYFSDVKKEIDSFFNSAESIVDGKIPAFDTVAMHAIVNHCETSSDVAIKKADFYHELQFGYGIVEDKKDDYYSEENYAYNLESDVYTDPQVQESWKIISHINKLRKGRIFLNNTDAEYLAVTNTKSTLNASKAQTEKVKKDAEFDFASDYAVSVDRMTNILWYKLGNGFGKRDYPSNVNMVLKARIVLATSISHTISDVYTKTKEQHKNGEITSDQLAARIITLRRKPILPEELEGESIDEIMDFSFEFLSRYEEEVNSNKAALREKELEIHRIEKENKLKLQERDETIAQKDQLIQQRNKENDDLASQLAEYRKKEAQKQMRKDKWKRIFRFILSIAWKLSVILLLTTVAVFCERKLKSNTPLYICAAVDLVGLFVTIWVTLKKDVSKYFPQKRASIIFTKDDRQK